MATAWEERERRPKPQANTNATRRSTPNTSTRLESSFLESAHLSVINLEQCSCQRAMHIIEELGPALGGHAHH